MNPKIIINSDKNTARVFSLAKKVACHDANIMLTGESGVGKEVIAQYIHQSSHRVNEPFVAINCAAIPENMLEAILFGYEKGAFTGAIQTTIGKFELANNGTILLDEITELPLTLQAKILRVIQEGEVEKLGSHKTIKINTRIIATTNKDLKKEVREGNFREDLFYRLHVFPIEILPLRSRADDILPLAEHFINIYSNNNVVSITDSAKEKLKAYSWPGNIRELGNIIQRAIIICQNNIIDASDIEFDSIATRNVGQLYDSMRQSESEVILKVLKENNGSKKNTADKLGISERTLRYKLARIRENKNLGQGV